MRINLKQFKKIKENNDSATLKNDRGHEITLSKKALRPHLLKAVTDLPIHLAEGSEDYVKDPNEVAGLAPVDENALQARLSQIANIPSAIRSLWHQDSLQSPAPVPVQAPELSAPQPGQIPPSAVQTLSQELNPPSSDPSQQMAQAPQAPAAHDPNAMFNDPAEMYMSGARQYMGGLQNEAMAEDKMRQNLAPYAQAHAEGLRNSLSHMQEQEEQLNQERAQILQDIRGGQIKPNHYMESLDSGQRTTAAIGLFLSGVGASWSGKENIAMKFLNDQIDRDIKSQQINLGSKENLLGANLHQYGNLRDAMAATRVQMHDIMAANIAEQAAKSPYPLAQYKANQAIGLFKTKVAPEAQSLVFRRAAMNELMGKPGTPGGAPPVQDPARKIRLMEMTGMMPKEDVKAASEELGKAQELEKLRMMVEENARDLGNKFMAGKLEPGYRNAKINNLAGILGKVAEGRFNLEESKNQMDAMMPGAFNAKETRGAQAAGRQQFFDSLKTTPTLQRYGIQVQRLQPLNVAPPVKGK